jgi:hypothetical protein
MCRRGSSPRPIPASCLCRVWAAYDFLKAFQLLAPVYAWFTEGFATKGLKDAKALLDELEPSAAPAAASRT